MTAFLVQHATTRRYLERRPIDGAWTWLAASPRYATVFSRADAEAMASALTATGTRVYVAADPLGREAAAAKVKAA